MIPFSTLRRLPIVVFAAILACATWSCGGGDRDDYIDTATYDATSDSLASLVGQVYGAQFLTQLEQYKQFVDTAYNIDEFINGLGVALDRRHPQAFVNGSSLGLKINHDLDQLEEKGFEINRSSILSAIENNLDSTKVVTPEMIATITDRYNDIASRVMQAGPDKTSRATLDSLNNTYTELVYSSLNSDMANYSKNTGKQFNIKQFMLGLKKVSTQKHPQEFYAGLYHAIEMIEQIAVIENKGVNVRRETLYDALQKAMKQPKVDQAQLEAASKQLTAMTRRIESAWFEAENERLSKTDKAIQNIKTGEALVNKMKK